MASTDHAAELADLKERFAEQQERLAAQDERMRRLEQHLLEAQDDTSSRSRRDLLRMAGFTVAGIAAGGAALSARPALAANPPLLLNQDNLSTDVTRVSGNANTTTAFLADGSARRHGVGVLGYSTDGYGVFGEDFGVGVGVAGSSPASLDLLATGSGRLGLSLNGSAPGNRAKPGWSPRTVTNELIAGLQGELWYGWTAAHDSTTTAYWRRFNSIRFDNGNGSGSLLVPYRAVDTRAGSPLSGGGTLTQGIAPVGHGVSAQGIPHTAIGVVGNLTAVSPNYSGFLTLFPAGGTNPALTATPTSTVNFVVDGAPTPNSFVVGLGGGAVSIYANNPGGGHSVHVLLDVTGYVE